MADPRKETGNGSVQTQCVRVNLRVFGHFDVRVIFAGEMGLPATLSSYGKRIQPLRLAYYYVEERQTNCMLILYKSLFTNSVVLTSHNTLLHGNMSL